MPRDFDDDPQLGFFPEPERPSIADNLLVRCILNALESCGREYCGTCGGVRGTPDRVRARVSELAQRRPDALYEAIEALPLHVIRQLPHHPVALEAALRGVGEQGRDPSRFFTDEMFGADADTLSFVVPSLPVDGENAHLWLNRALDVMESGNYPDLAVALARSPFARAGDPMTWQALLRAAGRKPRFDLLERMLSSCAPENSARPRVLTLLIDRLVEMPMRAGRMYARLPFEEAEQLYAALRGVVSDEGALALRLWERLHRADPRRIPLARTVMEAARDANDPRPLLALATGTVPRSRHERPFHPAEPELFPEIFELLMKHAETTDDPDLLLTIAGMAERTSERDALLGRLAELDSTRGDDVLRAVEMLDGDDPLRETLLDALERIAPEHERSVRRRAHRERVEASRQRSAERTRWLVDLERECPTAVERLTYVAGADLAPVAFPPQWAECTDDDLRQLSASTRAELLKWIERVGRGPWKRLARRLRELSAPEGEEPESAPAPE